MKTEDFEKKRNYITEKYPASPLQSKKIRFDEIVEPGQA
jgi:hypothetical protein